MLISARSTVKFVPERRAREAPARRDVAAVAYCGWGGSVVSSGGGTKFDGIGGGFSSV
jgi:hypothetical protein